MRVWIFHRRRVPTCIVPFVPVEHFLVSGRHVVQDAPDGILVLVLEADRDVVREGHDVGVASLADDPFPAVEAGDGDGGGGLVGRVETTVLHLVRGEVGAVGEVESPCLGRGETCHGAAEEQRRIKMEKTIF